MIYFILIVVLISSWFFLKANKNTKKKNQKMFALIAFFAIFLICALRHPSVGRDVMGYKKSYDLIYSDMHGDFNKLFFVLKPGNLYSIHGDDFYLSFESGYMVLMYFCVAFNITFQGFLAICYFIALFPLFVFIFKYSSHFLISVLVFICYVFLDFYLSGIRQSLSISIVLIGLLFLLNSKLNIWKRLFLFYLFLLIAYFFHQGIILAAIFPLLLLFKKPSFFFLLCFFGYIILNLFSPTLENLSLSLPKTHQFHINNGNYFGFNSILILSIIITLIYLFNSEKKHRYFYQNVTCRSYSENECFFINALTFSQMVVIFFGMNTLARSAMCFSLMIVVVLPSLLFYFKSSLRKIFAISISVLLFTYFSYCIFSGKTFDIYPYSFYWSQLL